MEARRRLMRAAVLTISTSRAGGEAEDTGGPALAQFLGDLGIEVVATEVLPDSVDAIEPAGPPPDEEHDRHRCEGHDAHTTG